jgi:hypothetical protein
MEMSWKLAVKIYHQYFFSSNIKIGPGNGRLLDVILKTSPPINLQGEIIGIKIQ